ncbi:hypothetical protein L228DRAFT_265324 [Xylona heveae TC161]|uniref:Uncharacterized protein n=1 Tax=Xylona heveae (strain CBS 132557 / TC161) TaxID=1328760 RepID=A0A165K4N4_XYLHT|nr:hypothetical protein L228DRAFT_265324 [Xylona heveae TC161]KZF26977.1 hypothetical protein L228DRAFT_265324 [Xylona heveae TC161]
MSSLNLRLDDDGLCDEGDFSYRKAFNILRKYLEPDSEVSIDKTAIQITDMLPSSGGKEYGKGDSSFAYLVIEIAEQIPYHHLSQVKLVWLVQRLVLSAKLNAIVSREGYSLNGSLSTLHGALYEYQHMVLDDDTDFQDQVSKCINMQAFIARLVECHFIDNPLWGIWTLRQALESEWIGDEADSCFFSGAAMWILLAGQTLFVQTVQAPKEIEPDFKNSYNGGPLYTGPALGLERWRFWQKAFDAVSDREGITDECKKLAGKAAELMATLERTMSW